MRDKRIHMEPTPENFRRYFADLMTEQERNAFERMLERDPFAREAAEGYSGQKDISLADDLGELRTRLTRGRRTGRRWIFYSMAAAAVSVLIISTFFLKLEQPREKSLSEKMLQEDIKSGDGETSPVLEKSLDDSVRTVSELSRSKKSERKKSGPEKSRIKSQDDGEHIYLQETDQDEYAGEETVTETLQKEEPAAENAELQIRRPTEEVRAEVAEQDVIPAPARAPARAQAREAASGGTVATTAKRSKGSVYPEGPIMISGRVISAMDEQPLPGVTVIRKGSESGTVTDTQGYFTMTLDRKDTEPVLVANFVGMDSEEVKMDAGDTTVRIAMEPSLMALDEVVVVGYGTGEVRDETGAVSEVRLDDMEAPRYDPARPVGGMRAFDSYIAENMKFPEGFPDLEKGVVILKFTVSATGRPMDIEVIKTPGSGFTREALRLLQEGPDWLPATRNDEPIPERVRLRLVFKH